MKLALSNLMPATYFDFILPAFRFKAGHFLVCAAVKPGWVLWGILAFTKALAVRFDAVCVVDEAVEDRVGDCGIPCDLVPAVHGNLTGDDGGSAFVSILDDLEELESLIVVQLLGFKRSTRASDSNNLEYRPSPRARDAKRRGAQW
jgi:hypothetical protein